MLQNYPKCFKTFNMVLITTKCSQNAPKWTQMVKNDPNASKTKISTKGKTKMLTKLKYHQNWNVNKTKMSQKLKKIPQNKNLNPEIGTDCLALFLSSKLCQDKILLQDFW